MLSATNFAGMMSSTIGTLMVTALQHQQRQEGRQWQQRQQLHTTC
jgi:hypothetical protein